MSNKSGASSQAVTLPHGGGALQGIGETFAPDPFTGTGNHTVPLELPAGRNGFQPQLSLGYSTGNGSGPFGLGWELRLPEVSRKTAKGVPRYRDDAADPAEHDTFIFSGLEDLVPVAQPAPGVTRFRPRTEGLFAHIDRTQAPGQDIWRVASRDGLVSRYGAALPASGDPAVVADPADPSRIFAWRIVETTDPFGNRIEYGYRRDRGTDGSASWDQLYLETIRYSDFEADGQTRFLVSVTFEYEERPDPLSEYRSGFEIRTRLRCKRIVIRTHPNQDLTARSYAFDYLDDRVRAGDLPPTDLPPNGVSLLSRIRAFGHDGDATEELPPMEFGYTVFTPERQTFRPLQAADGAMPPQSLADHDLEMVGLFGNGLPDVVQLNGSARFWRNLGGGTFDGAQPLSEIPTGVRLRDPGVQLADMDGNGRADLLVLDRNGYFPQSFQGRWSAQDFVQYAASPSVTFDDAELRLLDLDGDGVVDALRTGVDLELFLNDPERGWGFPQLVHRSEIAQFPDLHFSDPRVKLADVNGDNLQDIVLVDQGRIDYWPYQGHGRWGGRITMEHSPVFQDAVPLPGGGFDPQRVMLGDLDGDGLDDLVYVEPGRMTFWINRSGRGWSDPLIIAGTPAFPSADAVRLADVLGTGFQGVLWTSDQAGQDANYQFLELTGGVKPYVMNRVENHMGMVTRVEYCSSTEFYRADLKDPRTRWKAPLPFPVQVVKRVEVVDQLSRGKLTTEYRYHHGYWDGVERELRGFGLVEQLDTETFDDFNAAGPAGDAVSLLPVAPTRFSPPTLKRTWFHLGDSGEELHEREEIDFTGEYWPGDAPFLERPPATAELLQSLFGQARGMAYRALRGSVLRTELYALDGTSRADRPVSVTEAQYGLREADPPAAGSSRRRIFFPHLVAERSTQWERGSDPMTRFTFTDDYDAYGQPRRQVSLAVPRHRDYRSAAPAGEPYLVSLAETQYAQRDDAQRHIVDRVSGSASFEIANDGSQSVQDLYRAIQDGTASRKLFGQTFSYFDGEAFAGLPLGRLGDFGAMVRTESLVLTEEILGDCYHDPANPTLPDRPPYLQSDGSVAWTAEYPQEFRDSTPALAAYTFADGSDHRARGYFAPISRVAYDFQVSDLPRRGLRVTTRDPLGHETATTYDRPYHLFPLQVTDMLGLTTSADYDYRVLRPRMLTDANGNRRAVSFSPLGLVSASAAMGKEGEPVGDTLEVPGIRLEYDFFAFTNRQQPVFVRSIVRQHHVTETDVPQPARDETIETVEYTDGFGRLLQTRAQAEDVLFGDPTFGGDVLPADQSVAGSDAVGRRRAPGEPPRVIVTGWQVYDNKGRVVERYEPFFSTGQDYGVPGDAQLGQKVTMFYDPRGNVARTLNPDGSEQRVIHGVPADLANPAEFEPTPWEAYTYDPNDLAPLSQGPGGEALAGAAPASHHFTPSSIVVDALGRTVEVVSRNGSDPADRIRTRSTYDIRGNLVSVTDALGRVAFRYRYDLADRPWRIESIDAGLTRTVLNALGNETERRDSKGSLTLHGYDRRQRPARVWARDDAAGAITLRQRLEYGDAGTPEQDATERAAMRARNLLGLVQRHYDEAGLVTIAMADFKGNVVDRSRRVIADAPILAVFAQAPANAWRVTPFQVDWQPGPQQTPAEREGALLEDTAYRTTSSVDALNRVTRQQLPQDVEGRRRELRPVYSRAGRLEQVWLDNDLYVEHVAYNAKGQRVLIAYGNGVMTRYAYEPHTFRLKRLRSERYTKPDAVSYHSTGEPLQDLGYDYDLAGNVLAIRDRAPDSGFPNNPEAAAAGDPALAQLLSSGDALNRRFDYDPLYRLLSASGRECDRPPVGDPWQDAPRCTDLSNTRGYTEQYRYDAMGNLLRLQHRSDGNGFTRELTLDPESNRLQRMELGDVRYEYAFDASGNLRSETTSRHFEWNHADQLKAFRTQTEGAEPSLHAHYLYDATGRRIKKLVRLQGGQVEVTHSVDAAFEHQRWGGPASGGENNQVHVMDDQQRAARVRLGEAHPDDRGPAVEFLLADHLGSSNVVVDAAGAVVNREEFTPYGETSFGSFARKRYRFTGKERDESGLSYHVARYYCAWLTRWLSCDPAGQRAGTNLYRYAHNSPLNSVDPSGREPKPAPAADNLGNVAPYKKQPKAGRDAGGARTTENEHVVPRGKLKAVTHNAQTGKSDYTDSHYRKDTTVVIERDTALTKTHANRGGPTADNAGTAALKAKAQTSQPINYQQEVLMGSLDNALKAARETNSCVPASKFTEAALGQDGNLFATQRLATSGNVVRNLGHSIADDPNTLEFDLIDEPSSRSSPLPGQPDPAPELSTFRRMVSGEAVNQCFVAAGYGAYAYQLANSTTMTEAVNATTDFTGAVIGSELGGTALGAVAGVFLGPEAIPAGQAAGNVVGGYLGSKSREVVEETDWKEVAFVAGMVALCLL